MIQFAARRFGSAVITMIVMSLLVFGLSRLSGDPRYLLLGDYSSPEAFQQLGEALGLEQPLPVQYWKFISHAAVGDFGFSFLAHESVNVLIGERIGATLQLALAAFAVTILLSGILGMLAATHRGSWIDMSGKVAALTAQSVPSFWLGIVLIFVVAIGLGWLPTSGRGDWKNLVLPAFTLSANSVAALTLLLRSAMIDTFDAEYVKLARMTGASEAKIAWVHCLRNASLVPFTYAGLVLAHFLTGAIVVESVFGWPGIGSLALQAVQSRDYQLLQGVVLIFAAIYVSVAFLVDVAHGMLDPRVHA